ncbi:MAG: ribosome silencing factor [Lentisphaerae bacterium]|nr:ribosome silencing factor [Lentisphaerota bacterium]
MTTANERVAKAEELANFCIKCAEDKIAENPILIKLPETSGVADFFVVATANSEPHLQALANHIERQVREVYQTRLLSGDGGNAGGWILLDFNDVIVHLMLPEIREKYQLETLWGVKK